MELRIAGGCGEHGRNCFHVVGQDVDFLVDCGLKAGVAEPYPRLNREEISQIQAVFLTHSHADHTGALPWLEQMGFRGEVIATRPTLRQLAKLPEHCRCLESLCSRLGAGEYGGMTLSWGRAGHCLGSVWYRFSAEGKTLFFSGDYTEESGVYRYDPIRGQMADFAVVDCAYGRSPGGQPLRSTLEHLLADCGTVALPVPKYGRGLDLLRLLQRQELGCPIWGDTHFLRQLREAEEYPEWYAEVPTAAVGLWEPDRQGVVFLSDPQLKTASARAAVEEILARGGTALATGTVELGSYSEGLLRRGSMRQCRYPVHLDWSQYTALLGKNAFRQAIPYHSPELPPERECFPIY